MLTKKTEESWDTNVHILLVDLLLRVKCVYKYGASESEDSIGQAALSHSVDFTRAQLYTTSRLFCRPLFLHLGLARLHLCVALSFFLGRRLHFYRRRAPVIAPGIVVLAV